MELLLVLRDSCSYRDAEDSVFDRSLAAQAELDDLTLVAFDPTLAAFPYRRLW